MFSYFDLDLFLFKYNHNNRINIINLLLTIWFLEISKSNKENIIIHPIPFEKFKLYYGKLWEIHDGQRKIKNDLQNNFLFCIADKMNTPLNLLPYKLFLFLNSVFQKLEDELCNVLDEDLNPKYLNELFIID